MPADLRQLEKEADAEIEKLGGWADNLGKRRTESPEARRIAAEWASALGAASLPNAAFAGPLALIEDLMVPMIKSRLPSPIRQLVDQQILIRAAPLKDVNASAQRLRSGVLILINVGLPLLLFRIIGHAFALIETRPDKSGRQHVIRVHPATPERTRAVAGSLLMFAHPEIEVSLRHMPKPGRQGFGGASAFGKILSGAEHFVVGHELGHALVHHLGMASSEAPGIRELVDSLFLPVSLKEQWIDELTADLWGVTLTSQPVSGDEAGYWPDVAGASCLVALQILEILEWVYHMPSSVPFPAKPDPDFPLKIFGDHPPADLRLHVAEEYLRHRRLQSLELSEPYRMAVRFLLAGLARHSKGACIAPTNRGAWPCGAPRTQYGWLCEHHSPARSATRGRSS